jgi:hypothetical protein
MIKPLRCLSCNKMLKGYRDNETCTACTIRKNASIYNKTRRHTAKLQGSGGSPRLAKGNS